MFQRNNRVLRKDLVCKSPTVASNQVIHQTRWYNKRILRKDYSAPRDFSWIENYKLNRDLYFSQLKKKLNCGIGLLAQTRNFALMHLMKTLYFSLFNLILIWRYQIWEQDQNKESKRSDKDNEFAPFNVNKSVYIA